MSSLRISRLLNEPLAASTESKGWPGREIRRVPLPASSPRGGFLTQGSILKVSANGTTTSPVTRGVWILRNLLGQPPALPPPGTPAIEPDVRGATTIREQLAKHRSAEACASCHAKIDPPGFALESFDVIGGWRDRYRALDQGSEVTEPVRGQPVKYKMGLPVDASGEAFGGQKFHDIAEFRRILLENREQLARNLTEKLLVYATGAEIQFADRAEVEAILAKAQPGGYGLRTLIREVVASPVFQKK